MDTKSALKALVHRMGCGNSFLRKFGIFKSKCFRRNSMERNYMHGSIFIENISFSRNCDIKTITREWRHGRSYLGKIYF